MKAIKTKFFYTLMCMVSLFLVMPVNSFATTSESNQQSITVRGIVTDRTGEALPGVAVVIKGTTTGVATDIDGEFVISVPDANAVLEISYIGFITQTVRIGNSTVLNVVLEDENTALDELVVVGYGVQRRANLTGSVSSISNTKIENRASPNLSSSLAGLAAGVSVRQNSGNPGDDSRANIRIRGLGTFSGDHRGPMVIVDGIESNMDAVNPNDVESISVLKDASSAAIYGSRAANGVILITTKRGARDARPTITYSGLLSAQSPSTKHKFLWDHAEYMDLMNMATFATNNASTLPYDPEEITEWRAAQGNLNGMSKFGVPNFLAYPNTDWADVLFERRFAQSHNVQVSGGSTNSNYLLSLGYLDNPGVMQNTGLERFQMRVNLESRIADFLRVGTQTFALRDDKQVGDQSAVFTNLYQQIAGVYPYYEGRYGGQTSSRDNAQTNNLLRLLNERTGNQRTHRLNTTWFASVSIIDGLTADARFNYQTRLYNEERWPVSLDVYNFRTGLIVRSGAEAKTATTYRNSLEEYRYTSNLLLNYSKIFGDHSVSGLLGYEQMYWNDKRFDASRTGLIDMSITDITTGAEMQSIGGQAERDYAMRSYFGRINYVYKGRYLFETNVRRDGTSRFSPENRWGTFPSLSAGWRISEEAFMESISHFMDNLMLRASWGKLGNTTSGYYDWQATYATRPNVSGGANAPGLAVGKFANPFLQWESITSSEVGLNTSLFKQQLHLEFTYYNKLTEGILTTPNIYSTMGMANAPTQNTSDMRNRGIEVAVTWNQRVNDFRYSATVNFAYNQNEIVRFLGKMVEDWQGDTYVSNIGQTATLQNDNRQIRTEGHMFDEFFLRKVYRGTGTYNLSNGDVDINGGPRDGMIRTPQDLQWVRDMIAAGYSFNGVRTISNGGLTYGELIYADLNGDGNYGNSFDRAFTGKSDIPKYTLGFTGSVEWKGFDLNMTWAGNFGMHYYLRARGINQNDFVSPGNVIAANARNMFYYFNEANPNDPNNNIHAPYPRMLVGTSATHQDSDHYLYNASYFKLKFLQLGYTLPRAVTSKMQIDRLRLFVNGENLLTFTKYPGMDPEIGANVNVYPISRMISGGINITF